MRLWTLLAQTTSEGKPHWLEVWEWPTDGKGTLPMHWWGYVLAVVLGLAAVKLAWWAIRRIYRRFEPWLVFHRIAKQVGLPLREQWWLTRVARKEGLATPLTLLLSPATLDHHGQRYASHHAGGGEERARQRLSDIHQHLFASPASS